MMLPMNHAQTHVAGPPEVIGTPKVAGTEPSTPRMEIAYDTVDHREKCLCNTYPSLAKIESEGEKNVLECSQFVQEDDRRRQQSWP